MVTAASTPSPTPRRLRDPWGVRMRDLLSTYLPILLMVLLALATWWLVRQAPTPAEAPPTRALTHDADYTMRGALLQSFDREGRLRVQIEGDLIQHFPDTDTLEIDAVRLRSHGEDGTIITAVARRARAKADGSEVRLLGGATVQREATARAEAMRIEGEYLLVDSQARRVRSHLPVTFHAGQSVVRAAGFEHDEASQTTQLFGPLRATVHLPAKGATPSKAPRATPDAAPKREATP